MKKSKLVHRWGVNDVDYHVTGYHVVGGKKTRWRCPYYVKWSSIIERCFSVAYQNRRPTYEDCTVCEEWKYLSNFIKWVDSQPNRDWENCVPDKDLLLVNNKHYSPETVVLISKKVNSFILDCGASRGRFMIGVASNYVGAKTPFISQCCNPFVNSRVKSTHLGVFNTELEAHKAWQAKKHEYARQLADLQEDPRVAKALRERYAPDKDWTNKLAEVNKESGNV